jgi:hypothetical protein
MSGQVQTKTIQLPHRYEPRSYQLPLWQAFDAGTRRFVTVWHRRSGKDTTWLNLTIRAMYQRVGTYVHLFPQLKRGRKILWDGRNRDGMPFLDHFPAPLVKSKNEAEMQVELLNGSIWRIDGMEHLDSIVGSNPVGIVFSEYSQMKSAAWDLTRPILLENDGWAAFNFTPRGRNHAFELYQMALTNPDWYCSLLTVEDTRRDAPGENGLPIITPTMLDAERREGMREALLLQEYYCSFEAGSALQFIPAEYVQASVSREPIGYAWAPKIVGVDVGRNRDRAVIVLRQGGRLLEKMVLHPHQMADNPTEHIRGWLSRLITAPSALGRLRGWRRHWRRRHRPHAHAGLYGHPCAWQQQTHRPGVLQPQGRDVGAHARMAADGRLPRARARCRISGRAAMAAIPLEGR